MNNIHSRNDVPLQVLLKKEEFAQVRSVLQELPPADREILTLRYALDYDSAAIAETLGINVAAVHMRLSRARHRLAERLTAQGVISL
jgi:RNA polymerase sigma-70 factor (ECF subfamily)